MLMKTWEKNEALFTGGSDINQTNNYGNHTKTTKNRVTI